MNRVEKLCDLIVDQLREMGSELETGQVLEEHLHEHLQAVRWQVTCLSNARTCLKGYLGWSAQLAEAQRDAASGTHPIPPTTESQVLIDAVQIANEACDSEEADIPL